MRAPLFSGANIDLFWFANLKTASMTEISVAVVSVPVNAVQSLTTIPAAMTSLPLLTVPAHNGIYKSVDSSSSSATPHIG